MTDWRFGFFPNIEVIWQKDKNILTSQSIPFYNTHIDDDKLVILGREKEIDIPLEDILYMTKPVIILKNGKKLE